MTVAQLIARLQFLPQGLEVAVRHEDSEKYSTTQTVDMKLDGDKPRFVYIQISDPFAVDGAKS